MTYFKRLDESRRFRRGSCEQLIILGLGSGYQVLEMHKQVKSIPILVIENDQELVERVILGQPGLNAAELKICVETDWTKLSLNPDFRDAVVNVYDIFVHGPSTQLEPEFYQGVESLLRGRDKLSFLHLLKTRPELLALFDSKAIENFGKQPIGLDKVGEAVGLEQICGLFHENSRMSRERRLWRALEELIT